MNSNISKTINAKKTSSLLKNDDPKKMLTDITLVDGKLGRIKSSTIAAKAAMDKKPVKVNNTAKEVKSNGSVAVGKTVVRTAVTKEPEKKRISENAAKSKTGVAAEKKNSANSTKDSGKPEPVVRATNSQAKTSSTLLKSSSSTPSTKLSVIKSSSASAKPSSGSVSAAIPKTVTKTAPMKNATTSSNIIIKPLVASRAPPSKVTVASSSIKKSATSSLRTTTVKPTTSATAAVQSNISAPISRMMTTKSRLSVNSKSSKVQRTSSNLAARANENTTRTTRTSEENKKHALTTAIQDNTVTSTTAGDDNVTTTITTELEKTDQPKRNEPNLNESQHDSVDVIVTDNSNEISDKSNSSLAVVRFEDNNPHTKSDEENESNSAPSDSSEVLSSNVVVVDIAVNGEFNESSSRQYSSGIDTILELEDYAAPTESDSQTESTANDNAIVSESSMKKLNCDPALVEQFDSGAYELSATESRFSNYQRETSIADSDNTTNGASSAYSDDVTETTDMPNAIIAEDDEYLSDDQSTRVEWSEDNFFDNSTPVNADDCCNTGARENNENDSFELIGTDDLTQRQSPSTETPESATDFECISKSSGSNETLEEIISSLERAENRTRPIVASAHSTRENDQENEYFRVDISVCNLKYSSANDDVINSLFFQNISSGRPSVDGQGTENRGNPFADDASAAVAAAGFGGGDFFSSPFCSSEQSNEDDESESDKNSDCNANMYEITDEENYTVDSLEEIRLKNDATDDELNIMQDLLPLEDGCADKTDEATSNDGQDNSNATEDARNVESSRLINDDNSGFLIFPDEFTVLNNCRRDVETGRFDDNFAGNELAIKFIEGNPPMNDFDRRTEAISGNDERVKNELTYAQVVKQIPKARRDYAEYDGTATTGFVTLKYNQPASLKAISSSSYENDALKNTLSMLENSLFFQTKIDKSLIIIENQEDNEYDCYTDDFTLVRRRRNGGTSRDRGLSKIRDYSSSSAMNCVAIAEQTVCSSAIRRRVKKRNKRREFFQSTELDIVPEEETDKTFILPVWKSIW